ncbi:MAG TPA: methyltransferase domain-containing protein [Candidatus Thermoplasmatota archaeon]|nr:methyltransferase domain-containing protein [Candidatus Thermoplasmatota archaeon]
MTWTYTEDYYREYTRQTWNESAEAYADVMRQLEPFRAELLDRVAPRPGERALDVATGPGEPAMTLARKVAPGGSVVGVDLSERMVELASKVAAARGLQNCEFRVMDAEKLALPDASFDLAVSAFGLQIVTDPEAAAREMYRVLRPGGRAGVTVWSTGDKVPAIHAIIGPMLENAEPDETGYLPTPYEMGGPGEMVAFLEKAGFRSAREERMTRDWTFRDEEHYLQAVLKGTPIGHSLSEEEAPVQEEVLRKTRANLARWKTPAGLALPAECVVVTASK